MALKTNNTTVAIGIQTAADTFDDPTTNYIAISQCRFGIEGVTLENDEYTGSPFRNAPDVAGKRATLTYNVKIRHPGGSNPPAANAFLPGLILQAAKFTELRTTTAIPVAPEAVSAGSTTGFTAGAGATGTDDLYKGMAVLLSDNGATYAAQMTAIRDYTASKVVTLVEELGSSPAANYQIVKQLGYMRSVTSDDPILISQQVWLDGHRFDLMNCRVSGLQMVVPTSTKDQAAYPELQVTWACDIAADAEEATPSIVPAGPVPLYKDGDCWLALTQIGTQTFTIDLGLSIENPPNPNKANGSDAAELVGGVATVQMTRQKYLPSVIDTLALADAQAQHPFWAQWKASASAMIQIVVPDARLNHPNPDMGGNLIMESGDLMIDAYNRSVCINFTY